MQAPLNPESRVPRMWVPPSWAGRLLHLQQHQQTAACCQASVTTPRWCSCSQIRVTVGLEGYHTNQQHVASPGGSCLPAAVPSPWDPSAAASVVSESLRWLWGCPGSDSMGKSTLGGIGLWVSSSWTPSVLVQPPLAAAGTGRARLLLPDTQ